MMEDMKSRTMVNRKTEKRKLCLIRCAPCCFHRQFKSTKEDEESQPQEHFTLALQIFKNLPASSSAQGKHVLLLLNFPFPRGLLCAA